MNDHTAQIESGRVGVQGYIEQFQAARDELKDVVRMFRVNTIIAYDDCRFAIKSLQSLREHTCSCIAFLEGDETWFEDSDRYNAVIEQLQHLDGEKTFRLLLTIDLFRRQHTTTSRTETVEEGRNRIDMHLALQRDLKEELQEVSKLIMLLNKLATEEPQQ